MVFSEQATIKFWAKVDKTPGHGPKGECWIWTACTNKFGYGQLGVQRKHWRAHRFGYTLQVGPIPEGLHVLHDCDNPPCVRGSHLFLGTDADNTKDKMKKGRQKATPRKYKDEQTAWCTTHQAFLSKDKFQKNSTHWNKLATNCRDCVKKNDRAFRKRAKRLKKRALVNTKRGN